VVGAFRVHRASEGVVQKVCLPSEELHEDHASESVDGGLFEHLLVVGMGGSVFSRKVVVNASTGNKVLIALDRASCLVMGVVG